MPHWGCADHAWIQSARQVCAPYGGTCLQGKVQDGRREHATLLLQVSQKYPDVSWLNVGKKYCYINFIKTIKFYKTKDMIHGIV